MTLANKGILHICSEHFLVLHWKKIWVNIYSCSSVFQKTNGFKGAGSISPCITQLYLVFPHAPPFLIFLCLHLSSSTLSLCHLLSHRSSLSHIQVCTVKCFQIGNSWGKGGSLQVSASLAQGLRCSQTWKRFILQIFLRHFHISLQPSSPFWLKCTFCNNPRAVKSFWRKSSISFSQCQPFLKWSSDNLLKPMTPIRVFIPFAAQFQCSMAH